MNTSQQLTETKGYIKGEKQVHIIKSLAIVNMGMLVDAGSFSGLVYWPR